MHCVTPQLLRSDLEVGVETLYELASSGLVGRSPDTLQVKGGSRFADLIVSRWQGGLLPRREADHATGDSLLGEEWTSLPCEVSEYPAGRP